MNKYQRTAHAKLIISNLNWIYFCPFPISFLTIHVALLLADYDVDS